MYGSQKHTVSKTKWYRVLDSNVLKAKKEKKEKKAHIDKLSS